MGTYIGIDTESDISYLTFRLSQFINNLQFGNGLYVKAEDVIIQPEIYFPVCFAYSGKHYLIGRKPRLDCRTNFTTTNTVRPQSAFSDNSKDFGIGISLYRIMHRIIIVAWRFSADASQSITQYFRIVIIKRCTQFAEFINRKCSFHTIIMGCSSFS